MASRARAPTRDLEHGPRTATAPLREAAAGNHHHARSAVAAVGLERQPPAGPERLPSDRPGPCGPSGLCRVVVHKHSIAPHPVACCEPWAASSKAAGSPQAIPRSRRTLCSAPHPGELAPAWTGATRKMRLTDFCNRLPSRAPCGLLCFRPRPHAAPRLAADRDAKIARSPWA